MDKKKIESINILRFLAAVSVMLYHYTFMFYHRGNNYTDFGLLRYLFQYGYLGVDLFFIISGFVVALSAEGRTFKEFTISRLTRLYPVLWASVSLTYLVFLYAPHVGESSISFIKYLANLTMIPQLFQQGAVDGSYWSLLIEIKFYIFIGLLVMAGLFKYIRAITIAFTFALFLATYFFHLPHNYYSYFAAGVLFYSVYKKGMSLPVLLSLVLSFTVSIKYALSLIPELSSGYNYPFNSLVICLYVTIFYGIFLLISLKKWHFKDRKIYTLLGLITYPLYLLHQEIGRIFYKIAEQSGANHWLALIVIVGFVILLAYLLQRFYEKRAQNILRKFLQTYLH